MTPEQTEQFLADAREIFEVIGWPVIPVPELAVNGIPESSISLLPPLPTDYRWRMKYDVTGGHNLVCHGIAAGFIADYLREKLEKYKHGKYRQIVVNTIGESLYDVQRCYYFGGGVIIERLLTDDTWQECDGDDDFIRVFRNYYEALIMACRAVFMGGE